MTAKGLSDHTHTWAGFWPDYQRITTVTDESLSTLSCVWTVAPTILTGKSYGGLADC